jgi:hypothetical protein
LNDRIFDGLASGLQWKCEKGGSGSVSTNVDFVLTSSHLSNVQQQDLLDLVEYIENNTRAYLSGSPLLRREKGEPMTLASFALGITVASVPAVISAITEWLIRKRVKEVELEVVSGDQKVIARFHVMDKEKLETELQETTRQLESVLKG